ncbi:MAG: hypothetical protein AAGD32_05195 [Planctomycetota bacterium]
MPTSTRNALRRSAAAVVENLETRKLLAVTAGFDQGVLTVNTTDADETVTVTSSPSNGELFVFVGDFSFRSGPVADLQRIELNLGGGVDRVGLGSLVSSGYDLVIDAGPGDDNINLKDLRGHDAATVRGGAGDDFLQTSSDGNDELFGDAGNDALVSFNNGPKDILRGGEGDDSLNGLGNHEAFGDGGVDTFSDNSDTRAEGEYLTTLRGGDGDDIIGRPFAYTIRRTVLAFGDAGDDTIGLFYGTPTVFGGEGDDNIIIGRGQAHGEDGDDSLTNNTGFSGGTVEFFGGLGNDNLQIVAGSSLGDGGAGDDTVSAGDSPDTGDNERMTLLGGAGDDRVSAGLGRGEDRQVTLRGGEGDDTLSGTGATVLDGEAGNDSLLGGTAPSEYIGGSGVDILDFTQLDPAVDITVTRDGIADDGPTGTNANVNADIEAVFGADTKDADAEGAPQLIAFEYFDEPQFSSEGQLSNGTPWTLENSGAGTPYFTVGGTRLFATDTDEQVSTFRTESFDISGGPVTINWDMGRRAIEGEFVSFGYRLDGGEFVEYRRFDEPGDVGLKVQSPALTGQTLALEIRLLVRDIPSEFTTVSFRNLQVIQQLQGNPPSDGTPLFSEPFDEPNGSTNGTLDPAGAWRVFAPNGGIAVQNGQLRIADTVDFTSWFTTPLDIAGAGPVSISADLTGTDIGPDDLARFTYSVDGGPLQQFGFTRGTDGSLTATAGGIIGDTLKLEFQFRTAGGSPAVYTLDNVAVTTEGTAEEVTVERDGDTVFITGTSGDDVITVQRIADGTNDVRIVANGVDRGRFDASNVLANLGDGDDDFREVSGLPTGIPVTVNGGTGNDTIVGGASSNNEINGGLGDDSLRTGLGGGIVRGGDGNDIISGSNEASAQLFGGGGNDDITIFSGTVDAGTGDDTITKAGASFGTGPVTIDAGAGNDTVIIRTPNGPALVRGGDGNDRFDTSQFDGVASGFTLLGEAGNDTLVSGVSADDFTGGAGTDTVDYTQRTDGPFNVTFDNVANDGAEGEGDNIRDDVEVALGVEDDGPSQTLFAEPFDEPNGANSGTLTPTGTWRTFLGAGNAPDLQQRLRVADGKLLATNTEGFVSWFTSDLDIAGQGPVDVSLDLVGTNLGADDLARFIYRLDGGATQQFAFVRATDGSLTATAEGLTGDTLKIEVQFQALQGQFTLDNFAVTAQGTGTNEVSITIDDRVLRVTGTEGDDEVLVNRFANGRDYDVSVGGEFVQSFDPDSFDAIEVLGLGGNDTLEVQAGFNDDIGGFDDDAKNVFIDGGLGNDDVTGFGLDGEVRGGAGDDTVRSRTTVIAYGDAGDDRLSPATGFPFGFTGYGGAGNDTLRGSDSESAFRLFGEEGDDFISATGGFIIADGGEGDDIINLSTTAAFGRASANVSGGAGADTIIFFEIGNSFDRPEVTVDAGPDDDVVDLSGQNRGTVNVDLGDGNDRVITGNEVFGTQGPQTADITINGGAGNDTLVSGKVTETFNGGSGNDTVDYTARTGEDITVSFDGQSNDGSADIFPQTDTFDVPENDNIGTDVENVLGATVVGQPSVPLYEEPFDEADGSTTGNLTPVGTWRTFQPDGGIAVQDGVLVIEDTTGFVSWFTNDLDISGAGPVGISIDLTGTGLGPDDLANFLYRVDGGSNQQFAFTRGTSGSLTATATGIIGSTLKLEVQFKAVVGTYTLDNVAVTAGQTSSDEVNIEIVDRQLQITGTSGDDDVFVDRRSNTDGTIYLVLIDNVVVTEIAAGDFDTIFIDGGAGSDRLGAIATSGGEFDAESKPATIIGSDGDDRLFARTPDASLLGNAGNDSITIDRGIADGGTGNDTFVVGSGSSTLIGGDGDDEFSTVAPGSDPEPDATRVVQGGSGNDTLFSGRGADDFSGGSGTDTVNYSRRVDSDGPFFVTLDNLANDGGPGEGDNIRDDVEQILNAGFDDGSGANTLYLEDFTEPTGSTTGQIVSPSGLNPAAWQTFRGGLGAGTFEVRDGALLVENTDGVVSWFTNDIEINGTVDITLTVTAENLAASDYARFTYTPDFNQPQVQFGIVRGENGTFQITAEDVDVRRLKLEWQFRAEQGSFRIDNLRITQPNGPEQVTAEVVDGVLQIDGTQSGELIRLRAIELDGGGVGVQILNGPTAGTYETRDVLVNLLGGPDNFDMFEPVGDIGEGLNVTVNAGLGDDRVIFRSGVGVINGGEGDDFLVVRDDASATTNGGDGADRIRGADRATLLARGGEGNDTLETAELDLDAPRATLFGDAGDDLFQNGPSAQDISGGDGQDTVRFTEISSGPDRPDGPITVSFDGQANDGAPSENDNIADDVEIIEGATIVDDPATSLYAESFDEANSATTGTFDTATWNTFRGAPNFSVQDDVFRATDTDGFRTWYTNRFDISGGPVDLSLDLASIGELDDGDRLNVLVRVDGGSAQIIATFRGSVPDDFVATLTGITGSTLQVEVQANVSGGAYTWDNFRVSRA